MPESKAVARRSPDIEQPLEHAPDRTGLRRAADKLRAHERSQKRRLKASRDEKLRTQVISAMRALGNRRQPADRPRSPLLR
jgi:hypothetical protein